MAASSNSKCPYYSSCPAIVLMLPWLAHGHISPFLDLAKKLSTRSFIVFLCSTPANLSSVKDKLTPENSIFIQLVELHLPSLPELPSSWHTTNGLPHHLMSHLKMAFDMSTPSLTTILRTLKPDLLIYDFLQPWAPAAASIYNIPSVLFLTTAAAPISFVIHTFGHTCIEYPFPEIYLREYEKSKMARAANGQKDADRFFMCVEKSTSIILIKTFGEIEGKYIESLSSTTKKKIVPVGSLLHQNPNKENDQLTEISKWLNKKDQTSTVFVSFGSEYFLSSEDMKEIAHGLELSKVCFIWVVRFPTGDSRNAEEALPQGFLERVGERGMVVNWAPQREIIGHPSIGGIVSHCGWGSVMEAIETGVPIVAMPMQLDQPWNARLVEEIGVGIEVIRERNGQLNREELARVIRKVVMEKTGQDVRRKAKEMSELIRKKEEEEMDGAVMELLQLCGNSK
ncbi:UDP-glucosyltransferase 29-like [Malania oleifera]|uniref:UDP-glucosyltransferase 29-like n=1 Tax=Malania oleifera TaxID=397392 RepID=UPI0025AEA413|nr:UDP-glucosyltransferase 29-like [Malania oleifera]